MDFVKVDNEVLLTRRDGEPGARALVFVNALGTDLRIWDRLTRYLSDRFHIVRYDMRGQGLSSFDDPTLDVERLGSDLAALMDQLDTGPAAVVGCEFGGLAALRLAERRPELAEGLILLGTGLPMDTPAHWRARAAQVTTAGLEAVADEVLDAWFAPVFRAQRGDETRIWRNMLLRTPPSGFVAGCGVLADDALAATVAAVRVPTLVLTGSAVGDARRRAAAGLVAGIDGAVEETVATAAVLAQIEQPAPVAAAMLTFLEAHDLA